MAKERRRTIGSIVCLALMAGLLALMITVQCAVTGWVKRPLWLGLWITAVVGGALLFAVCAKTVEWDWSEWTLPAAGIAAGVLALAALAFWWIGTVPAWLVWTCYAVLTLGGVFWFFVFFGGDACFGAKAALCLLLAFVHFFIAGLGRQGAVLSVRRYENGFFYTVHADDTAELVMYDTAETLVIPQAVRGAAVVSAKIDGVEPYWWADETVEKLVVDDAFTAMPDINFTLSGFRNLREASVNGLASLPSFLGCESLRTVRCAGAQEIPANTFTRLHGADDG